MDKLQKIGARAKKDLPFYSKNFLRIINKQGERVPFVFNPSQLEVHRRLQRQLKETGRIRALVLKSRQLGISTYSEARLFWRAVTTKNANAVVISHLNSSSKAIFEMIRHFYDHIPHQAFKPETGQLTQTSISFEKLNSQFRVHTARTGDVGRGQTNKYLHLSEVAFFPQKAEIVAGLLQTVPRLGSEVILESTANGAGGWFYERCLKAIHDNNKGASEDWELIFLPWTDHSEYRVPPDPYFEPSEYEEYLTEKFGLDNSQLNFRRLKIAELGSEDLFKQEYPLTPQEAFLFSGRTFVESTYIENIAEDCFSHNKEGEILPDVTFSEKAKGRFREWRECEADQRYCIGVDVAEGLEGRDYSCAQVMDAMGNQVACWHGHIDPFMFGDLLRALGLLYNKAWMVVERNNHGLTTIRRLQELGYPNLYVDRQVDNAYADKMTKKAGFLTTSKTKPVLIDGLATLIRQGESGIVCKDLVGELRTYVLDDKGHTNAQQGCHDDRVMSYALALWGLQSMPRNRRFIQKHDYEPVDGVIGY